MSIQHAIGISITSRLGTDGAEFLTEAGSEVLIDEQIPPGGGTTTVTLAIDRSKLKSFVLMASHDGNPAQEISIAASPSKDIEAYPNIPVVWYEGCGVTVDEFFNSDDIEDLECSNATGLTARLQVFAIVDPT